MRAVCTLFTFLALGGTPSASAHSELPPDIADFASHKAAQQVREMTSNWSTADRMSRRSPLEGKRLELGEPHQVQVFTQAYRHGDASGLIAEPDGTWIVSISGGGEPAATAILWREIPSAGRSEPRT